MKAGEIHKELMIDETFLLGLLLLLNRFTHVILDVVDDC